MQRKSSEHSLRIPSTSMAWKVEAVQRAVNLEQLKMIYSDRLGNSLTFVVDFRTSTSYDCSLQIKRCLQGYGRSLACAREDFYRKIHIVKSS